ncbi:hypothetical protein ANABIO32_02800 [Rossellomorea marisflavi]|uniref:hypothetical protein n=1 Tax=Rossellomorea marisflavi TaxID=189381 RepID=UPI0025C97C1D|nr:hypothetical protein [Rossellomorea marisflavi]GLI82593.1 hypothetical protein ANABIO32_02800 [Rossellomorea marisflavi]
MFYTSNVVEEGTYWIPFEDENNDVSSVTVGKSYEVLYDLQQQENFILDDKGTKSLIFLCHNGEMVRRNSHEAL